jgi:peroxiredoxin
MKRHEVAWAAVLLLTVSAVILYVRAPRTTWVKVGGGIPDATLPVLGAQRVQMIQALRGLPLLLVFFDTTSASASSQLSQIQSIHQFFLPRALRVVGVAVDADAARADRTLREWRVSFLVLSDPGGRVGREVYHIESFPEAYLVEQSGRVAAVFPGPIRWRTAAMDDLITGTLPRNAPRPVR